MTRRTPCRPDTPALTAMSPWVTNPGGAFGRTRSNGDSAPNNASASVRRTLKPAARGSASGPRREPVVVEQVIEAIQRASAATDVSACSAPAIARHIEYGSSTPGSDHAVALTTSAWKADVSAAPDARVDKRIRGRRCALGNPGEHVGVLAVRSWCRRALR